MIRECGNFYDTESGDSSRNKIGRRHERAFWYKTPYTKEAHSSLSEKSYKNVLRVSFIY